MSSSCCSHVRLAGAARTCCSQTAQPLSFSLSLHIKENSSKLDEERNESMAYTPSASLLHGVPLHVAECYGKPHISCSYIGESVNKTKVDDGALCVCCGALATNAHHYPPKRTSPTFKLRTLKLKPALFAVCGSGTTGCHDEWHGGARYKALWRWDCDDAAREWWEGGFCGLAPHDPMLYVFGCWELYDMKSGRIWQVRS